MNEKRELIFTRILVPTDLSENSKKALDTVFKMGVTDEHRIFLLHVIETLQSDEDNEFQFFYDKLRDRAARKMGTMIKKYGNENFIIEKEIVYGNRSIEIIRFAHEYDINLIVLTSHRIENLEPSEGWATISYKVGILSPCPVLLVK